MNSPTVVTLSLVVGAQAHGLGSARVPRADFGVSPKSNQGSRGERPRDAPETGALPLPFHKSSADCGFNFT